MGETDEYLVLFLEELEKYLNTGLDSDYIQVRIKDLYDNYYCKVMRKDYSNVKITKSMNYKEFYKICQHHYNQLYQEIQEICYYACKDTCEQISYLYDDDKLYWKNYGSSIKCSLNDKVITICDIATYEFWPDVEQYLYKISRDDWDLLNGLNSSYLKFNTLNVDKTKLSPMILQYL